MEDMRRRRMGLGVEDEKLRMVMGDGE